VRKRNKDEEEPEEPALLFALTKRLLEIIALVSLLFSFLSSGGVFKFAPLALSSFQPKRTFRAASVTADPIKLIKQSRTIEKSHRRQYQKNKMATVCSSRNPV